MITRTDVAKKAGVSVATVSHVMNETKYVSPELREKVNTAIRLLNYRPNIVARSLVTKRTKHVGIVVNDITNPYYGEIAQGMEEIAHKHGYTVSLCLASDHFDSYLSSILQRQMDGIFIATVGNGIDPEHFQPLADAGIAIVNGGAKSYVNFDYTDAMNSLIKYYAAMGHKRIGYLSGLSINTPIYDKGNDRYSLYRDSLKKLGLVFKEEYVVDGMYPYKTDYRSGYEAMKTLLKRDTRVTAIFAINDYMAFGAVKAIREEGLKIPDDISVAGCDDIFFSECFDPALTTIRVPKTEMGRQAMYLILNEIREKKTGSLQLKADLMIRDSTGPVKSS